MPPKPTPSCPCVPIHAPIPLAFQVHHVVPRAWRGKDIASNRVTICGTCHDNVHHALDQAVHIAYDHGGDGTLTPAQIAALDAPYTAYTASLIARACTEVGANIPRVFTLTGDPHVRHI